MFTKTKGTAGSNGDISLIASAINEHVTSLDQQHIVIAGTEDLNGADAHDGYENATVNSTEIEVVDTPSRSTAWRRLFHSMLVLLYILLIIIAYFNTSNAFHIFSWMSIFFSLSYVACVVDTLAFSTQLCYHTMEYTFMNGVSYNYIPHKINVHEDKPWDSISHLSHIRGSSIYKWHTVLLMLGSFSMLSSTITKMFHLETNTTQQRVAVYCLLCASIGGLILANTEVYISPSFSRNVNLCSDYVHTFGAFCFLIIGNLAFTMYNGFHWMGNVLLASAIFVLILYFVVRMIEPQRNLASADDKYEKWVHNMSRINIGLEVLSFVPCTIAWSAIMYQFGEK
eukprot:77910_1